LWRLAGRRGGRSCGVARGVGLRRSSQDRVKPRAWAADDVLLPGGERQTLVGPVWGTILKRHHPKVGNGEQTSRAVGGHRESKLSVVSEMVRKVVRRRSSSCCPARGRAPLTAQRLDGPVNPRPPSWRPPGWRPLVDRHAPRRPPIPSSWRHPVCRAPWPSGDAPAKKPAERQRPSNRPESTKPS
jgi:hypothetical protein